jgi:hypothetical protein
MTEVTAVTAANEFLSSENMRALAAYILDEVSKGDTDENMRQVVNFIMNMVSGMLLGGSPDLESAVEGLNALRDDIEDILTENFDEAKAAMAESDAKKQ